MQSCAGSKIHPKPHISHILREKQTVATIQITHRAHAASAMWYLNAGGGLLFVFGGQLGRSHPLRHLIGDMHVALNTEIQRLCNEIKYPPPPQSAAVHCLAMAHSHRHH